MLAHDEHLRAPTIFTTTTTTTEWELTIMARGRIAPDADFFNNQPPTHHPSSEWGEDEWDPALADEQVEDEFGDQFAGEYTTQLSAPTSSPSAIDDDEFGPVDDEFSSDAGFDSDHFLRTPQKPTRTAHSSTRRRLLLGTAAAAVLAAGAVVVLRGGADETKPAPLTQTAPPSVMMTAPTTTQPASVTGNGPGDVTSGPGVIFGYTSAYYTKRDGKIAAAFLTPDQNTAAVSESMQRSIDKLDPKLEYSLTVTATANPMVFDVVLKVTASDTVPHTYNQQFTVANQNGRYYLSDKRECGNQACPAG